MLLDNPFEIVAAGPLSRGQIEISYRGDLALAVDKLGCTAIEREWRRARRRARRTGIPMFSGRLVRIVGHEVNPSGILSLTLGPTSYREYVGTRAPSFFEGKPRGALANPLAVCAALRTADGGIVLGRRAGVDIATGQHALPGGFVERGKDEDPFAAIAREVHEELGLSVSADDFVCLGLIYALPHPHYELCFTARTALTFHEITHLEPTEREASQLERLEDSSDDIEQFLAAHHNRMSPSGEGCLRLYVQYNC